MDLSAYLSIASICAAGAMSPGPSLAVVLKNTMHSRRRGAWTGVGHGLGIGIYSFGAVVGAGALVNRVPGFHLLLGLGGAAYLLWMAFNAWRYAGGGSEEHEEHGRSGFAEGFLVAFLNPKVAVFFLALLGAMLPPGISLAEQASVAALAMGIDMGWYVLVALTLAGTPIIDGLRRHAGRVDRVLAVLLAGVGVALIARTLGELA